MVVLIAVNMRYPFLERHCLVQLFHGQAHHVLFCSASVHVAHVHSQKYVSAPASHLRRNVCQYVALMLINFIAIGSLAPV